MPQSPDQATSNPNGFPRSSSTLGFSFTMAFQPILDLDRREVYSHEALVRGLNGESALHVLGRVNEENRYLFDQICRIKALALGKRLSVKSRLNINFLPNALLNVDTCLRTTLRAAKHYQFPVDQIVFEVTEVEQVTDIDHVASIIRECQDQGLKIAIDDFGAGYAGLNLVVELHPDLIKLDIGLCRGIDRSRYRRAIVHGVMVTCRDLGVAVVAEGVETPGELAALRDLGVTYYQGFLFARPQVEGLPEIQWPR